MEVTAQNNKRLIINTLMLYFRMFLMMLISLYTSRVILSVLGVEDFGIYNIVGGVVASLSLITNSLSAAISRFITFELGKRIDSKLKLIFSTSVNILLVLSIIVLVIGELVGVWFVNTKMNIPLDRLYASNWVFQFSLFAFIVRLMSIPYNASIIAHEEMGIYAFVSIFEVILQLIIVLFLKFIHFDRLIVYSFLLFFVAFLVTYIYKIFCKKKFQECTYSLCFDKPIFREMLSFASWNFIGSSAGVLKTQGIDIIVNLFFGVTLNAARGIASQVNNAISKFSENFMTALRPQITKSYADCSYDRLNSLLDKGSRFSFYLLMILIIPLYLEMDMVLKIWLGNPPLYTISFTRLQLLITLISVLSQTLITAMLATGQIKKYQLVVGGITLCNFPISYILLKSGFAASTTYIVAIVVESICLYSRLLLIKKYIKINILSFILNVVFRSLIVLFLSSIFPVLIVCFVSPSFIRLIVTVSVSVIWSTIVVFFVGLNSSEKILLLSKVKKIFHKK